MRRHLLHIIGLVILASLFSGCTTEKNTRMSRAFHNVTSKYNVYFNANESLKAGVQSIEENIENDYTRILPIYKSSDPSAAKMVKSDMEFAVIKASKLIEIHSITAKPKRKKRRTRKYQEFASKDEFNKWIDDSYLLMGKAYFYQHNFIAAITNLSFVTRKYQNGDSQYEAYIWLIRSYSELGRFVEAAEMIQTVQADEEFPRKLERDLAIAIADYYMKQEEYDEAIKFLDIAIKKTTWKGDKARLQYIEAQLYDEVGKPMQAAEAYKAVVRMNPDYAMSFNAKINAAGLFTSEGNTEEVKKELRKMLRDKKNFDFRDQIYYALANIFLKEGQRNVAIENYKKSVASSFQNQFQRALSAITLADLYFEDLNYEKSQAYYDSAMIIVDETYPDYAQLSAKYNSLTNLIDNLMTVEREDSLQKVAQMPETERESLIARLMKEEQERQRNAENLALQGQRGQGYYRSNRYRMGMGSSTQGAGWYFYNPQTVSYGQVTFQQRWGRRKLEDDWRRSNKSTVEVEEGEEMTEGIDSSLIVIREEDPLKKEFYTQDLPLTDSLMAISHEKIEEALYNAGKIFKSEFSNYQRSAESFEELIKRYPESELILSSYFDLYDLYELMGDKQKSDYYRNLIISQYPNSKYAQYLLNPNFFVELEARTDSINRLYEETFKSYRSGRYRNVIQLSEKMKEISPDSVLMPKIDFMETVAQGTQTDIHNFESLLKGYVETYPNEDPTSLAQEILTLIQDSTLADYQQLVEMGYINEEIENEEVLLDEQMENDEFGGKYSYEEDLLHYFVIAYPREAKIDLNRLKFDIANYNIDHYTKIDFDIETENLNEQIALVIVRSLENKENAVIYHRAIIRSAPVFGTLLDTDYYNFAISSTNYRQILTEKSITDYLKFFVKNYSRFIKSDFSDEELEISPEELMAKAREEEEMLREKGEFVVVNTGASELFSSAIDTTQSFVLAVKDLGMSLRQALNGFSDFNRQEFRIWNLALQLKKAGDYQLIVIKGIPSLNESMSYFRKVVTNRKLFDPLGTTTYRNFLVTDENLQKIIDDGKVDNYMDFFRNRYIQSNRTSEEAKPSNPVVASGTAPSVREEVTSSVKEQVLEETLEVYKGPYNEEIEGQHYFAFVIPVKDVDKVAFIDGITKFNQSNYESLGLSIEEKPLDEFRQVIVITGLPDKDTAMKYFRIVVQNRDLYAPLGSGSYRNFLITKENFDVFLNERNILEYTNFYKRVYLDQ